MYACMHVGMYLGMYVGMGVCMYVVASILHFCVTRFIYKALCLPLFRNITKGFKFCHARYADQPLHVRQLLPCRWRQ